MGYLILWAPTSEGSDHALENVANILLKKCSKKGVCIFHENVFITR